MTAHKAIIVFIVFGLVCISLGSCKRGYMLTFPQELQVGASERFCLSLYNVSSDVTLTLNISCYGNVEHRTPNTFYKGEPGCFTWFLPDTLPTGTCDLELKGNDDEDYSFTESQQVSVVDTNQITFVQTDKPVYKPGQTVKFRVMTVTQDLFPVQADIESVVVQDPNGFHMKEWIDLPVKAGLVTLEYLLYGEPLLGEWSIVTLVNGRKTVQTFIINEYVLPKIIVDIGMPEALTVATKVLQFSVCSRYTFGQIVEGQMNATVCLQNTESSWYCEANVRPCVNVTYKINGCMTFPVLTAQMNLTDRRYSLLCKPRLSVDVNVTEKHTGAVANAQATGGGVWESRGKLTFYAKKYFKPYFPFEGKVRATFPDGSQIEYKKIVLTIGKLGIEKTLTTDERGYIYFTVTNLGNNIDHFSIKAETTDAEEIDRKQYTIDKAKAKFRVKQWYSPSSSYLELTSERPRDPEIDTDPPMACGDKLSVGVVYALAPDVLADNMFLQVMSKGNLMYSKDITSTLSLGQRHTPSANGVELIPVTKQDSMLDIGDELGVNHPQGPPTQQDHSQNAPPGAGPPGGPSGGSGPRAPTETLGDSDEGPAIKEGKPSVIPIMRKLTLTVDVTNEMFPAARVLVYIVTDQGEIIADALHFTVEQCPQNKVQVSFSSQSGRPRENVTLSIRASPDSLCSISMVDISAYQYGGLNLLQAQDVNTRLEQLDLTSDFVGDWRYCSDVSDLPPPFQSPEGPPKQPGAPGIRYDPSDVISGAFRKKRSLMEFHSNVYDSLLAFKTAGLTALTDLDLQTRPCLYDGGSLGPYNPGDPRGPIPGQGGFLDELEPPKEPVDDKSPVSIIRRYFPETWLWNLFEIPHTGQLAVDQTLPDTITEWLGTGVCMSAQAGLGISELARIKTFQAFFMQVKLPYSVIRGETVRVNVLVFNYMPHCLAIQVVAAKNSNIRVEDAEGSEPNFCICNRKSKSHTFLVTPLTLGTINLTFSAVLREHRITCNRLEAPYGFAGKQATDSVVRQLVVKPEGQPDERTKSIYVCPKDSDNVYKQTLVPDIPSDLLIPGSLRGWINVIGDIMGPVLSGLDDLVLLPTGCGEQNMVRLAPNIAVLQYLTATRQLSDSTEAKLLDHLNKGYQQQLKFMHADGSYSAFGNVDKQGSTWLSAFVFKTLRQALDFIYIDRKQIQTKTWEYLINQQGEDGCFTENGKVLGKYMMGGVSANKQEKERALTAYVLVAMLESFKMMRERTPPFVALAVRCIQVDNMTDPYTLALTAYAMSLYKPNSAYTQMLLDNLKEKAVRTDDTMYWKRDTAPVILSGQGRAASAEIEMTSYALLAMLSANENVPIRDVIPIVRWLTNQRNAYGGFASTQDTVVALQALSIFAQRIHGDGLHVNVDVANGNRKDFKFNVSTANSVILQQHDLSSPEKDVMVSAKGEGCVLLQTTYHYNVNNNILTTTKPAFTLSVTTPITMAIINNKCRMRTVRICVSYSGADDGLSLADDTSSMAVLEARLPSGWMADVRSLDTLLNSVELGIKKYEMDYKQPDVVNFYFEELDSSKLCFNFDIVQEVTVDNVRPVLVKVFEYYETNMQASTLYELSVCTENQIDMTDIEIEDLYIEETKDATDNQVHAEPSRSVPPSFRGYAVDDGNHIQTPDSSHQGPETGPDSGHPAPEPEPSCPQCMATGRVDILKDICTKQVWALEKSDDEYLLRIVSADGVSPQLSIDAPELLQTCQACQSLLLRKAASSLVILQPTDWTDLGMNLVRSEAVVIPWSKSLQTSFQRILSTCPPA